MGDLFTVQGISVCIFWIFGSYAGIVFIDRHRLFKNTTAKQRHGLKWYGAICGLIAAAAGLVYIYTKISPTM